MDAAMDLNEIKALGFSLRQIDQTLLKSGKDSSIKRIWYQGDESYFDMFFGIQNNQIVWFQFTLRGKVLLWDKDKLVLYTGTTGELDPDDVNYYPSSKLIKIDSKVDFAFVELVRSILQTRSGEPNFEKALALFES
ncbi:hypothetical protein [Argonema galeatum]|uniref:hypothetical protein n=1 Tax=Argonema galeatum TaxID=2942762 RepID=UPI00201316E8|nr:hypothetical protein [Argonema galeatum]MCL1463372.1 hypothetical protein [Argonema galeatum A003/A1]